MLRTIAHATTTPIAYTKSEGCYHAANTTRASTTAAAMTDFVAGFIGFKTDRELGAVLRDSEKHPAID
jgi:hypothetical protein